MDICDAADLPKCLWFSISDLNNNWSGLSPDYISGVSQTQDIYPVEPILVSKINVGSWDE